MSHRKRIMFLTPQFQTPSTRFRVLQCIPKLKMNYDINIETIPKKFNERIKLFNRLPEYELVFLQKKLFQRWAIWYIRKKSKLFIYDFDDAVMFRDSNSRNFYSSSNLSQFKNTIKKSDLIIAGNNYLKSFAEPFSKNITVVKTSIDTKKYLPKSSITRTKELITIGWIGSHPNLIYLKELIPVFNDLYHSGLSFQLKVVCDKFINGFDCPVENKVWNEDEEIADIQSFDIGIMPMIDDQWSKGKCALKLLQYMSCGLPSVSTRTEVTSDIIKEGQNGFLATTLEEWREKICYLVKNFEHLKLLGHTARESIIGVYDTNTIAMQYNDLFHKLLQNEL